VNKNLSILQQNIFTFVLYVIFSWLGLLLSENFTGDASSFYPAAGVALAATVLWGRHIVWSLILAAISSTVYSNFNALTENFDPLLVLVNTAAIVAQAFLGKIILNLLLPATWKTFGRIKDVFLFFLLVVIFCSSISIAIVTLFEFYINDTKVANLLTSFWFWWLGDAAGIVVVTPLLLKVFISKKNTQKNNARFIFPIIIFSLVSLLLVAYGQNVARSHIVEQIEDRKVVMVQQVRSILDNYISNIEILRNYLKGTQKIDEKIFTEIAVPFIEDKQWAAFSFNELVQETDRKDFEKELIKIKGMDAKIFSNSSVNKSQDLVKKPWYMVVKYIVPKTMNSQAIGYDISSDPERAIAVRQVMQSNRTIISAPINLIQSGNMGLLVLTPIHMNDKNNSTITGVIVGVIDLKKMIAQVIKINNKVGWHFKIGMSAPKKQVLYTQEGYPNSVKGSHLVEHSIDFGGLDLTLSTSISESHFISLIPVSSYAIPAVNLLILILFNSLILILWARQSEIDLKVKKQTRLLQDIHDVQSAFIIEHKTDKIFEPILTHMLKESSSQVGFLARTSDTVENNFEVISYCDVNQKPVERDELLRNVVSVLDYIKEQQLPFISNKAVNIPLANNSHNEEFIIDSCLFIPVIQGGKVIAIVGMMNTKEQYSLAETDGFSLWLSTFSSILHGLNQMHKKQTIQFELEKNYQDKEQAQERVVQQAKTLAELAHNKAFISGKWNEAFDALTLSACDALSVSRFSVWLFKDESTKLVCNSLYDKDNRQFTRGALLQKEHYPKYFEALSENSRITADDAQSHPATKELDENYLSPLGITSMLDGGIFKDGSLIGVVCAEHIGELRHWLPEEEHYINIISGLASQLIYSVEKNTIQSQLLTQQIEKSYIVDNMKEGVITIDERGSILTFNKAAEKMFGYAISEVTGKNISILMPNNHAVQHDQYLADYLESDEGNVINTKTEFTAIRKDKTEFAIMLNVTELPSDGRRRKFLGTCLDITVDKLQQQQLLHNQKMEALGQLTGGVAHDFNNILGIMMGYSELIRQGVSDKLLTYSEQVLEAGERARLLTKELLSFASKKEERSEVIDLNNLLIEKRLMLEKALSNQVQLIFSSNSEGCQVKVDPYELENTLLNLAINAKHAMNNKGILKISTSVVNISKTSGNLIPVENGKYVCLSIQDNGCGIEAGTLKKLFEPFYTTKGEEGTGLGLAQVYGFIQRSNGSIAVESKLDKGTTFNLYFPTLNTKSRISNKIAKKKELIRGSGTILIVDDEKSLTNLYSIELTKLGYKTLEANNVHNAIEQMAINKVDLVLSDILMPKVTGIDLAKQVLINYPTCKIQLMSGFSDTIDTSSIPHELYINRLIKPFSMYELSKCLHKELTR
jgi:PAS domain S-box-containing protein